MNLKVPVLLSLSIFASTQLIGCGGSSDSSDSISSNNAKTVGTISRINNEQITVNGVSFSTKDSTVSTDDGQPLGVGMVVTVDGSVDQQNHTGKAHHVNYEAEVKGVVISALEMNGIMNVMGQSIMVDDMTVFHSNVSAITSLDMVPVNSYIEVSGYVMDGSIKATRIELEYEDYTMLQNPVMLKVKGYVGNVGDGYFTIHDLTVMHDANTMFIGLSPGTLEPGMMVTVKSMQMFDSANMSVIADQVKRKKHGMDGVDDNDSEEIHLYGTVSSEGVVDNMFELDGQAIMVTENTKIEHGTIDDIVLGAKLKVEGYLNQDGVLVAHEIGLEGHDINSEYIKIAGRVEAVGDDHLTIMGINVYVNNQTWYSDDYHGDCAMDCSKSVEPAPGHSGMGDGMVQTMMMQDMQSFGLGDISADDFVAIKAYLDSDGNVVAVKVVRNMNDNQQLQELKGPVSELMDTEATVVGVKVDISAFPNTTINVGDCLEAYGMYDNQTMMFIPDKLEVKPLEIDSGNYKNNTSNYSAT